MQLRKRALGTAASPTFKTLPVSGSQGADQDVWNSLVFSPLSPACSEWMAVAV